MNIEINKGDLDYILLHQANKYLMSVLARNAKIPIDKVPMNIEKFGNTSGASIPLLICDTLRND
ncbi:3-oxoacyl-[acyl-carrier-protein] synthase III C-terminal domain-containing protein [Acetomicrobium sp.]|uniref:3-oxoacyl-[acyl-carrier-protein] synthase III C-terminal domain-containing protein n=1 Tax=Acetomicrobium sp. TaxID=1872099 RepID=UPI0028715BF8|nr:3-oxoacyl-[acyl-carrier-protein] synthase III C-terminal domain-containing protein [Acetomicrobium sp.]MDR9770465.1 3-oxoacyl-[acyl-carrier-protein] synthase III C-terminal domain-containing protein [Acetomicrobium sp.]